MAGERIAFRRKRTPLPHPDMLRGRVRRRRVPGIGNAAPTGSLSTEVTASVSVSASNVFVSVGTQAFARGDVDGGVAGDLASGLYQE
jgi:hypothetical protein